MRSVRHVLAIAFALIALGCTRTKAEKPSATRIPPTSATPLTFRLDGADIPIRRVATVVTSIATELRFATSDELACSTGREPPGELDGTVLTIRLESGPGDAMYAGTSIPVVINRATHQRGSTSGVYASMSSYLSTLRLAADARSALYEGAPVNGAIAVDGIDNAKHAVLLRGTFSALKCGGRPSAEHKPLPSETEVPMAPPRYEGPTDTFVVKTVRVLYQNAGGNDGKEPLHVVEAQLFDHDVDCTDKTAAYVTVIPGITNDNDSIGHAVPVLAYPQGISALKNAGISDGWIRFDALPFTDRAHVHGAVALGFWPALMDGTNLPKRFLSGTFDAIVCKW